MPKARKHAKFSNRSEAMKAYWANKKSKKKGKAVNLEQEGIWSAEDRLVKVEKAEPPPPKNYRLRVDGFAWNRDLDVEINGIPEDLSTADKVRLLQLIGIVCRLVSEA